MSNTTGSDRTYNVLFLCVHNAGRSQMAEAILNTDGAGRFQAFSGGTSPAGEIHPLTIETLTRFGYPTDGLTPKSWEQFAAPGAPHMDFVFTVCDDAAGESCPVWPGHPAKAHWGIEDPARVEGTDIEKETAFVRALRLLKTRISVFVSLPIASLDRLALDTRLRAIGSMEGASRRAAKPDSSPAK